MSQSMTVLVEYQVRAETTSQAEWLAEWARRAKDAQDGEPGTLAYAAAINTDNDLNVLVFERYADGDESLKQHVEREAHKTLIETMGAANMTKRRVMSARAVDLDHGWWSRPDCDPGAAGVYLTILNMRFADEAKKSAFLEMADEHIEYCREAEPESLIMGIGTASADADREIDLRQGDLLLVNGYTDEAAHRQHHENPRHVAFSERVKASGNAPENLFFRTYVSTGRGFLWRADD